jgi:hypothetical protein
LARVKDLNRLTVIEYMGFPTAFTGEGHLMTIQVEKATSDDTLGPEDASTYLANALAAKADDRISQYGIVKATRVGPDKRTTEDNGTGVNWMWMLLWFLTMFLTIISLAALFRKRSAEVSQGEEGGGGGGGSGGMSVPPDDTDKQKEKLIELVLRGEEKRKEREARRLEEIKYAPKPELFAATLEYENRVKLPPVGGIVSRKNRGKKGDNDDDNNNNNKQDGDNNNNNDGAENNNNNNNGVVRDSATVENRSNSSKEENNNNNQKSSADKEKEIDDALFGTKEPPQMVEEDSSPQLAPGESTTVAIPSQPKSSPLAPMGAEAHAIATRKQKQVDDDDFL